MLMLERPLSHYWTSHLKTGSSLLDSMMTSKTGSVVLLMIIIVLMILNDNHNDDWWWWSVTVSNTDFFKIMNFQNLGEYRKASSRGAYEHDPFWSVFQEHRSTWFHNNRYYNGTIYIIDNVIVLSDLVESSGYSSKTLQKGLCPYAPLDKVLR